MGEGQRANPRIRSSGRDFSVATILEFCLVGPKCHLMGRGHPRKVGMGPAKAAKGKEGCGGGQGRDRVEVSCLWS